MNDIMKEFSKPELLKIANELELELENKTAKHIIKAIEMDINRYGIPEEDDCSDLLNDYLYVAGFLEDDGMAIDEADAVQAEEEQEQPEQPIAEEELPDCYTCADERDPACKRCKLFESCMSERVAIRERELPCFGKLFDINAQECGHCLEAGPCKIALRDVKVI